MTLMSGLRRIAFISVHGCPVRRLGEKDTGGMNVYLLSLARELGRQGLQVDVFTRAHDPKDPQVVSLGDNARVVHIKSGPYGQEKDHIHRYLPQFLEGLLAFTESQGLSYDLLHAHYWLSARAGSALKARWQVPLVTSFHTLAEVKRRFKPDQQESPLRLPMEHEAVARADAIFAFTAEEKGYLIQLYDADPGQVHVLPGGVDPGLFHPAEKAMARRTLELPREARVVSYIGRMEPFKGVDLLLRAVALLQSRSGLVLMLLGGGSADQDSADIDRLRDLAQQLGIVQLSQFLGSVPQERLPLYYNASDVCVIPSFYETWGLVALEAMSCGIPVLASRVGGLACTVVDGVTGFLVPDRSPEAFALSLERLLEDETLRGSMGLAGRPWAKQFAWPLVAEQVLNVYHALIKDGAVGEGDREWLRDAPLGHKPYSTTCGPS